MPKQSSEHMKQAKLKLHATGQVSLKGRPPRATASSPSHDRALRHPPAGSKQSKGDGAISDGRESSSDGEDADPGLEAASAREQHVHEQGSSGGEGGSGSESEDDEQVGRASSQRSRVRMAASSEDEDEDEVPTRRSLSRTRRSTKAPSAPSLLGQPVSSSASGSDDDILPVRGKKRTRPRSPSASASEQAPSPKRSSKTKKSARAPSSSPASSAASADDDLPIPESIAADNKRRASKREHQQQDAALRSSAKKDKAQGAKKRRLAALTQGRRERRSAEEESDVDFVVEDDVVQYDSSAPEEEQAATAKRSAADKKGKGKARAREEDEDSDEAPARRSSSQKKQKARLKDKSREDVQRELLATDSDGSDVGVGGSSRRRKKGSSRRNKRRRPSSDDDDVDDEPDDLEILDEDTVRENKFRARQDKSSRFAQLKAARERASRLSSASDLSSSADEPRFVHAERAAKNKAVVLDSDDEPPSTAKVASSQVRHPHYLGETSSSGSSSGSSSHADEDEPAHPRMATEDLSEDLDGFIVDNSDDDQVVHSWRESVRGQSQGLRYYVKQYLSLLVFLIVDPQCDWLASDKEWRDAHQRVHSHLTGLLNSLISSSAWKPKFKHAVDTRPDMYLDSLEAEERGVACDACTMGKARHSTLRATVSGPKYDAKTLQPIEAEDDSSDESSEGDSDDEDERKRRRRRSKRSKDKTYEFALGASCAARAEVYHELKHWSYQTRQRLVDKLDAVRHSLPALADDDAPRAGASSTATATASRDERKKQRERDKARRAREAGRLVEELERRQVMGDFASKLVDEIERAQKAFAK
ncbi:hypothetical protein JCM9279_001557 [Rhodotorula babjevae]